MSDIQGLFLFQWAWQGSSGLAEDQYVNSWHFQMEGLFAPDYDNVRDMLVDFYEGDAESGAPSIANFMTTENVTGNYTLKGYRLTDSKPRTPEYETQGTVAVGGADSLPTECSAVFSFQAQVESGENQKRRRNRTYLGPFAVSANDNGMLKGDLVERMLYNGKIMYNASLDSATWNWVVYSPSDDNSIAVYSGWVDNAWDTQRRRGIQKTARGTFTDDTPN